MWFSFGGRDESDRSAPERVAGNQGCGSGKWQDDFDGLPATKRNIAKRENAVLRQSGFSAMGLHAHRVKSVRSRGKRAKIVSSNQMRWPGGSE